MTEPDKCSESPRNELLDQYKNSLKKGTYASGLKDGEEKKSRAPQRDRCCNLMDFFDEIVLQSSCSDHS